MALSLGNDVSGNQLNPWDTRMFVVSEVITELCYIYCNATNEYANERIVNCSFSRGQKKRSSTV